MAGRRSDARFLGLHPWRVWLARAVAVLAAGRATVCATAKRSRQGRRWSALWMRRAAGAARPDRSSWLGGAVQRPEQGLLTRAGLLRDTAAAA